MTESEQDRQNRRQLFAERPMRTPKIIRRRSVYLTDSERAEVVRSLRYRARLLTLSDRDRAGLSVLAHCIEDA